MRDRYRMSIRAGPESESSPREPFRYVSSRIPKEVESVDEEPYRTISSQALLMAREMVLKTGRNLRLTVELKLDPERK